MMLYTLKASESGNWFQLCQLTENSARHYPQSRNQQHTAIEALLLAFYKIYSHFFFHLGAFYDKNAFLKRIVGSLSNDVSAKIFLVTEDDDTAFFSEFHKCARKL